MATHDRYLVARVYDAGDDAGHRILIDRLWPRGLTKEAVGVEVWLKDVAPSNELRKWYGHDPDKYAEFTDRYHAELAGEKQREALRTLRELSGTVTLLTSAKEVELSHATVLAELLNGAGGTA
ncbi:DUF488 family protein [Tersicoccus sp. MR15.9]|uniref:DUF488 domain-containing protein n=1 Tax=Tersicoccus mangrovi TaxID=3121635 RepID=UPI002FE51B49